jgi:hypothetical protein
VALFPCQCCGEPAVARILVLVDLLDNALPFAGVPDGVPLLTYLCRECGVRSFSAGALVASERRSEVSAEGSREPGSN